MIWADLSEMSWLKPLIAAYQGPVDKHELGQDVAGILSLLRSHIGLAVDEEVHVVIMSNGGFSGIHGQLVAMLEGNS